MIFWSGDVMPKFLVDICLDGYESEEEMILACEQFLEEQLDVTAGSVDITRVDESR